MGMPRTLPGREQAFRNGSSWFDCSFWARGQEPDLGLPLGYFLAFTLCLAEWAGSLSGRRLCLRVRGAWCPVGLWLCSIVPSMALGRVSGTPGSRWWGMGQGSRWAGLPGPVRAMGLSAVACIEYRPGGCFMFLSSTVQEAGRKPGPRRWWRWQSRLVVRVGEPGASGRELALTHTRGVVAGWFREAAWESGLGSGLFQKQQLRVDPPAPTRFHCTKKAKRV